MCRINLQYTHIYYVLCVFALKNMTFFTYVFADSWRKWWRTRATTGSALATSTAARAASAQTLSLEVRKGQSHEYIWQFDSLVSMQHTIKFYNRMEMTSETSWAWNRLFRGQRYEKWKSASAPNLRSNARKVPFLSVQQEKVIRSVALNFKNGCTTYKYRRRWRKWWFIHRIRLLYMQAAV